MNDARMLANCKWIVCEQSGRWTAALRIAFARTSLANLAPPLYEVRSLAELTARLDEHRDSLGLIEVRQANFAEVLELLVQSVTGRPSWFVALLDDSLWQGDVTDSARIGHKQEVADMLWEAGVVDVVDSPRRLKGLLELPGRVAAARRPMVRPSANSQTFSEWAWSLLPWQDA
ncbi:MAG TPA: hypothetical protein VFW73_07115 [Lacipirellulaceae bacterium]|nr:hypothetical protein [Lacipirellulaceae bacterium]